MPAPLSFVLTVILLYCVVPARFAYLPRVSLNSIYRPLLFMYSCLVSKETWVTKLLSTVCTSNSLPRYNPILVPLITIGSHVFQDFIGLIYGLLHQRTPYRRIYNCPSRIAQTIVKCMHLHPPNQPVVWPSPQKFMKPFSSLS